MFQILRRYYNYILFRIGIREVLPAYFVNRIRVCECGEPLVEYNEVLVRKQIAEMLKHAQTLLPHGYSIKVVDGYRCPERQAKLRADTEKGLQTQYPDYTDQQIQLLADRFCARRSGHATGGAVDIVLVRGAEILDCGTKYLEFNDNTKTKAKNLPSDAALNRNLLYSAIIEAGFVNYPNEWWHYSFGDQLHAAYSNQRVAIYGEVSEDSQEYMTKPCTTI